MIHSREVFLKLENKDDGESYYIRPSDILRIVQLKECSRITLMDGTTCSVDQKAEVILNELSALMVNCDG